MTTMEEMVEIIKAENPNGLRIGSEETGYTDLTAVEYNAQIAQWAEERLALETSIAESKAIEEAKILAQEKLAALGLTVDELKALGL